jgi:hypothetical protein
MAEPWQVSPGDRVRIDDASGRVGRVEGMVYSDSGVVSAIVVVPGKSGGTLRARCSVEDLTVKTRAPMRDVFDIAARAARRIGPDAA